MQVETNIPDECSKFVMLPGPTGVGLYIDLHKVKRYELQARAAKLLMLSNFIEGDGEIAAPRTTIKWLQTDDSQTPASTIAREAAAAARDTLRRGFAKRLRNQALTLQEESKFLQSSPGANDLVLVGYVKRAPSESHPDTFEFMDE